MWILHKICICFELLCLFLTFSNTIKKCLWTEFIFMFNVYILTRVNSCKFPCNCCMLMRMKIIKFYTNHHKIKAIHMICFKQEYITTHHQLVWTRAQENKVLWLFLFTDMCLYIGDDGLLYFPSRNTSYVLF